MRRLIVFDGAASGAEPAEEFEAVLGELADDGWSIIRDWVAPRAGEQIACLGTIADAESARRALLAALGGAALVAIAAAERPVIDGLLDDLRRLGPVEHVTTTGSHTVRPNAEQRALLALLADGLTLGEAAYELGLARRTADRRLAAARRALGVERTVEAVAKARKLGWLR